MHMQKRSNMDPKFICSVIGYLLFDYDKTSIGLSWDISVRMSLDNESNTLHRPPEGHQREQLAMET